MKIGLVFPTCDIGSDPVAIRASVQAAEGLGFDSLLCFDPVLGAVHADREPPLPGPYDEKFSFPRADRAARLDHGPHAAHRARDRRPRPAPTADGPRREAGRRAPAPVGGTLADLRAEMLRRGRDPAGFVAERLGALAANVHSIADHLRAIERFMAVVRP